MGSAKDSRPRLHAAALLAACLALAAYANTLANGFAYDDRPIVEQNGAIHDPASLHVALGRPYWPGPRGRELGLWRPATTLALGIQWRVWEGDPAGFHAVNAMAHALATALLVLLAGRLAPVGTARIAGLLHAVHPVHAEAVANVVGLAELMAAAFYLTACLAATRGPLRMGAGGLAAMAALYLAAMLSKEGAATLPAAVLVLDGARRDVRVAAIGQYLAERWRLYAVLALTAALAMAGRVAVLGSLASAAPPLGAEALAASGAPRIWTVLGTWPEVFRLLILPLDLSADYSPAVVDVAYGWTLRSAAGLAIGMVALATAWITWRTGPLTPRRPAPRAAGFAVVWLVATGLPTSNLPFMTGVLLAERTLYLPSAGIAVGMAWLYSGLIRTRPRIGALALAAVLALYAARTVDRNADWKDNHTIFASLLMEHPESGRAQWILGDLHLENGDRVRALAAYRRAVGLLAGSQALLAEVAIRLDASGMHQAAERLLGNALGAAPDARGARSIRSPANQSAAPTHHTSPRNNK